MGHGCGATADRGRLRVDEFRTAAGSEELSNQFQVGGETPYAEGKGDSSTLAFGTDNLSALSNICSQVKKCIAINSGDGKTPLYPLGYGLGTLHVSRAF
jgi:hypothetical protein